ncbi:MAG: hypothetical protein R2747_24475 [Pyrinomonadaceae bacterium]
MKKILFFVFIIFAVNLFNQITWAQKSPKPDRIKVEGSIVAVDALAPLFNITFAIQQGFYIFRIEKLKKGNEKSLYLKVKYLYYPGPSPLLSDLGEGGKNKWMLKLERDRDCDSDLEEMSYYRSFIVEKTDEKTLEKLVEKRASGSDLSGDGVKEGPKVIRLKDTGGLAGVPKGEKLPCYVLKTEGIKFLGEK